MLHGKCVCAVFTYELISIRSQTCERCVRVRFVIQTNECTNSIRTHFSWCVMYIIGILRFKLLFNDNLWMHLKNALRDIWLAFCSFCYSASYTTLSMKTSFAPFWRVNLSVYVINLYSKQHSKRKRICKTNLWLVWIAVRALPNKASIHPTAKLH